MYKSIINTYLGGNLVKYLANAHRVKSFEEVNVWLHKWI